MLSGEPFFDERSSGLAHGRQFVIGQVLHLGQLLGKRRNVACGCEETGFAGNDELGDAAELRAKHRGADAVGLEQNHGSVLVALRRKYKCPGGPDDVEQGIACLVAREFDVGAGRFDEGFQLVFLWAGADDRGGNARFGDGLDEREQALFFREAANEDETLTS